MHKPAAYQTVSKLTYAAYTQGYDGKPLALPEGLLNGIAIEKHAYLNDFAEHQHLLGASHAAKGKKSDYCTAYGIGRHG